LVQVSCRPMRKFVLRHYPVLRKTESSPRTGLPNRRTFLAAAAASGALVSISQSKAQASPERAIEPTLSDIEDFELDELTIGDLQAGLRSGQFTSRSLVEKYLARIDAIDKAGPTLRSVIEVNPDALALADQADREREASGAHGSLHGIPILVKDNFDTADRMATTAGSLALVGSTPSEDAFVVKRLRKAGAILLGKTNLSEWSSRRSKFLTNGWSARGGLTINPYALDRSACGSSSGSAVAVSANLCAAAVGTDTVGSVLGPASACGIVGIRPTVGLISRTGIVPISCSQDTPGPMARTVRDAAILLGVLAGGDSQDTISADHGGFRVKDYTQFLTADGLKGARIGVARNYFGFHDAVDSAIDATLCAMKKAGAVLVDIEQLSSIEESDCAMNAVLLYELKARLNTYLARRGPKARVKSLKDVIKFNDCHKQSEMAYFGQDLLHAAEEMGPLSDPAYSEALAKCRRLSRTEGIDAAMTAHKLDALVAPTVGPACMIDMINGDRWLGGSVNPAAMAGYPSITIPAGAVFGLPVGLSFIGSAWSEPSLLRMAYATEQATKMRKPPQFLMRAHSVA
jgi:amidase